MKEVFSALAGLIALGGCVPYAFDIVKGRARPARSARLMFAFLLVVTILHQGALHCGWLVIFTAGELTGSVAILALAIKHGMGGLSRLDKLCYVLIFADVILWLTSRNALLALHFSLLADLIAFLPTLAKTWQHPETETPVFFTTGIVAPALNMLAAGEHTYGVLLFPVYLALVNLLETLFIILRPKKRAKTKPMPTEPVI